MEKTREELQLEITAMTLQTEKYENDQKALAIELVQAKQQLADVNKPEITEDQYTQLCDAIEDGLRDFDWDEIGNYEIDFGIDYGNQIVAENITFNEFDDLLENIEKSISSVFKTAK